MQSVTVTQVRDWCPCARYTEAHIAQLFAGRLTLTGLDILELDILQADKLWALLRREFIDELQLDILACTFAERAADLFEALNDNNDLLRKAIATKYSWIEGLSTDEDLETAMNDLLKCAFANQLTKRCPELSRSTRATVKAIAAGCELLYPDVAHQVAYDTGLAVAAAYDAAMDSDWARTDELDKQLELIRKALS